MNQPSPSRRPGSALRKLVTVLCGIGLFLLVVALMAVWSIGRFAPKILDASLSSRTGARLAVETNDTNLFAGRVSFSGLTITNPSRWQEREFLKIRRIGLEVETWSFLFGNTQVVREAELDIEQLVIVGKEAFMADNNAKDIGNGLKGQVSVGSAQPAARMPVEPAATRQAFHIDHLRVRVNRITVIAGDGTPGRRVIVDRAFDYVFDARGITDRNFNEKVSGPMGQQALQNVIERQPELIMDLAREKLRKSVTEKLLGDK